MDGDGNFDIRKSNKTILLKAIRIKVHIRDVRILATIQDILHFGRIRYNKKNPYCTYIVSTQEHMRKIITLINGLVRLKVNSFKKACAFLNVIFRPADYTLKPLDPYFAGIIDSDGTILFNYKGNRVECILELKLNEFSKKLNLDYVVPNYSPSVYYVRNGTCGLFQFVHCGLSVMSVLVFAFLSTDFARLSLTLSAKRSSVGVPTHKFCRSSDNMLVIELL